MLHFRTSRNSNAPFVLFSIEKVTFRIKNSNYIEYWLYRAECFWIKFTFLLVPMLHSKTSLLRIWLHLLAFQSCATFAHPPLSMLHHYMYRVSYFSKVTCLLLISLYELGTVLTASEPLLPAYFTRRPCVPTAPTSELTSVIPVPPNQSSAATVVHTSHDLNSLPSYFKRKASDLHPNE